MKQVISPEETEIMRSAYVFLSKHCNPPANQNEEAPDWWLQTVQEMAQVCTAWDNHPLIGPVLLAIIDYLEIKAKKKSEGNDHV